MNWYRQRGEAIKECKEIQVAKAKEKEYKSCTKGSREGERHLPIGQATRKTWAGCAPCGNEKGCRWKCTAK